jgi:hypothetical protein
MLKKLLVIALGLFSISNAQAEKWVVGGIYATPNEGGYTLIKVLKVDKGGVHIRMYSNLFKEIPSTVDENKLFMAPPDNEEELPLGMGHAPISHKSFSTWGAVFIVKSTVSESELEGYKMWEDAKGGYF